MSMNLMADAEEHFKKALLVCVHLSTDLLLQLYVYIYVYVYVYLYA